MSNKKIIPLLSLVLVLLFLFTSCSLPIDIEEKINKKGSKEYEQMSIELIVESLNNNSTSGFKNLFSRNVRENNNIDEGISNLLDFINGEIIEYQNLGGKSIFERVEKGHLKKEIRSSFLIATKTQKYYIAIRECVVDEFDPNNIGLYSFNIVNEIDWPYDYIYTANGAKDAGIYIIMQNTGNSDTEDSSVCSSETTE